MTSSFPDGESGRASADRRMSRPVAPGGGTMAAIRRRPALQLGLLLGPTALWVAVLIVLPAITMLIISFWRVGDAGLIPDFTLDNYHRIATRYVYRDTMLRSLRIAGTASLLSLVFAVPISYLISFKAGRHKTALFALVVASLWVGYLMRAYAWRIILAQNGVLSGLLMALGLIDQPLTGLMYSETAVLIALIHLATPFAVIPIFITFEQVPRNLHEVAADLGAGPLRTALLVTLPLTAHGIISGAAFAFILTFGDFVAPELLGGPSNAMIANVTVDQFGGAYQWPLGSAISVTMFVVVVVCMSIPEVVRQLLIRGPRRAERSIRAGR